MERINRSIVVLFFVIKLFLASAATDPLDLSALRALYGAMSCPLRLTGWNLTGGDPCGGEPWLGVICSGQSVVSINISGLGLGGFLGLQLSDFLSMNQLDVSNNNIGGEIPNGLPPNAIYINLANNKFTGTIPHSLASLKSLNQLNVSHNSLSGSIANVFTDMQILRILDLSFNQLSGDLPSSISSLSNLSVLYLQGNQFTGSISFLANLPLSTLYLQNNHFSGFLPKQIETIPNLRIEGNMFPLSDALPPQSMNTNAYPPHPSSKWNVSQDPLGESSTLDFSSADVLHPTGHRRLGVGTIAGVICGFLSVVILVMMVSAIYIPKYWSTMDKPITNIVCRDTLPISSSDAPTNYLAKKPRESYFANSPSSFFCIAKHEKVFQKKNSSRQPKNGATAKVYSASDLLSATNNYSEENVLGEDAYGRAYKALLPEGQVVAVKKIEIIPLGIKEEDAFLEFIRKTSHLRHPNIASLTGYCMEHGEYILVYEYVTNGSSLDTALFTPGRSLKPLSWNDRARIALGVGQALDYMHWICSSPLAHGNIRTSNIFLNNEFMPLVADCGLALLADLVGFNPNVSADLSGHRGYIAPEQRVPGVDKRMIDTYCFGVVLLELLTGKKAFDSSRRKDEQYLVSWASCRLHDLILLEEMVDPAIKGSISYKDLSLFADIIILCIQPQHAYRYQMSEISEKLAQLVQSIGGEHGILRAGCPDEASDSSSSYTSFKTTIAAN